VDNAMQCTIEPRHSVIYQACSVLGAGLRHHYASQAHTSAPTR